MATSFQQKLTEMRNSVSAEITKFKNKDFLEATIAGVVAVANADGTIDAAEKQKVMQFVQTHEALKLFKTEDVVAMFNKFAGNYEFDATVGQEQALSSIMKVKKNESSARMVVRVCCVVGAADGNFDDQEKEVVRTICSRLGLSASDFGL
jgi:tellurite resistance protein TerB